MQLFFVFNECNFSHIACYLYTYIDEIFKLEGITRFYDGATDLFPRRYSSLARPAVRPGDENRPTASPIRYRKIAFFSLGARRRRIVFMKWCRLLLDLTRLERNPSRRSRWLRRGLIRLTALFDSLLLRVRVLVRVSLQCVYVCACVCINRLDQSDLSVQWGRSAIGIVRHNWGWN